jgi:hypothetical protein
LQFEVRAGDGAIGRGRQQDLVEPPRVRRVADRRGDVGVADDRLAQIDPALAQPPRRPLGPAQRVRPAGREVDRSAAVAGWQRRDQQRESAGTPAGVAPQGGEQLRVLRRARSDHQRLPRFVERLLVFVDIHLGLPSAVVARLLRGSVGTTLPRRADRALKRG